MVGAASLYVEISGDAIQKQVTRQLATGMIGVNPAVMKSLPMLFDLIGPFVLFTRLVPVAFQSLFRSCRNKEKRIRVQQWFTVNSKVIALRYKISPLKSWR